MLNRIFGLETEYGLLVNEDQPDHSPTWFAHKIRDHLFHVHRVLDGADQARRAAVLAEDLDEDLAETGDAVEMKPQPIQQAAD